MYNGLKIMATLGDNTPKLLTNTTISGISTYTREMQAGESKRGVFTRSGTWWAVISVVRKGK